MTDTPTAASRAQPLDHCGFMLSDVARLVRRNFNRRVTELKMTQEQWRTIAILSRNPGISQKSLADILEMQPISVGRLIDRLQAAGFIERRPDPADRRAFCLHLTPQADPILKKIKVHANETIRHAMQGISEADQQALFDILARMRTNLAENE